MPGAGTKATGSGDPPATRLLDLSRLVSRVGRGAWTGIDRVEAAYLDAVLAAPVPAWGLVRMTRQVALLDAEALHVLRDRLHGAVPWGPLDLVARLHLKQSRAQQRAEADIRRLARATASTNGLAGLLARHLPSGGSYLNVGHSRITARHLTALDGWRIGVMIHDLIPLDHPEYQRPGTVERFSQAMAAVSAQATQVICVSRATEARAQHWFSQMGRVPDMAVAPLGVEVAAPVDPPFKTRTPYFVTLGTIEPRKNHMVLLRAWEEMGEDPPHLHIVGARGWENRAVFDWLDTHPLVGQAVFEHSGLSDGQVAGLLRGSAGLLFPSFVEGYGLPPLEAKALGVPVLAADLPVYAESLGDYAVYADTEHVYSWVKNTQYLVEAHKAGRRTEPTTPDKGLEIPKWSDHFNFVFKLL